MITHTTPQILRIRRIGGPGTGLYYYRGWLLKKEVRDWDARPYRGSTGNPSSKITWVARKQYTPKYTSEMFSTRHEAIAHVDLKESAAHG